MVRRYKPRSPYTPPVVRDEDVLLYKNASAAEEMKKTLDLTPEQEKRLAKMEQREEDKQDRWAKKLATRADVVGMMSLWQERFLLPLASRLDAVEAYVRFLELPFYKKWWVRVLRLWVRVRSAYYVVRFRFVSGISKIVGLFRSIKGIRFVKLKGGDGDGREASSDGEPSTEG